MATQQPLALVTGGARGYGAVVSRHLASAGFTVAVLGRSPEAVTAVADEIGGIAIQGDVLDGDQVTRSVASLVQEHGPVDLLVNNAGVGGTLGLAWEVDPDDWWRTFEVNVRGTHLVTRAVLPGMVQRRHGRIINIASHAGVARWPFGSPYATSKAALIKYGENLAAEVRRFGITVLSFHPGILEIGLTGTLFAADPEPGTTEGMVAAWFRKEIAEGRSIDADASAAQLVRLGQGLTDPMTGRYFTAYDDLDAIAASATTLAETDYTLGLLEP